MAEAEEFDSSIFDMIGIALAETRTESIQGRAQSGIEKEWLEDEEYYEGIDEANRGEMSAWGSKPAGQAAIPSSSQRSSGSTIFVNITRPYCDAWSARVGDMLLPTDDRGWAIKPTPVPEMLSIASGQIPQQIRTQVEQSFPGDPDRAEATLNEIMAEEKARMKQAREMAEKAQRQIEDWHVEGNFHAEVRKIIEDTGRVGTGVIKGPVPAYRSTVAYLDNALVVQEEMVPVSSHIDIWNCFPDPGCGESIHDGNYHWERADLSRKALRALLSDETYFDEQIREVLKEGPHKAVKEVREGHRSELMGLAKRDTEHLFEVWYYYGVMESEVVQSMGCDCEDTDAVPVCVTMINNRVIRLQLNHLDTGEFPYDYMVGQRRAGLPYGAGVARQIRAAQRMVNGAARNMMDNAGLAGGPMWIFRQGLVEPIDGEFGLAPRKGWMLAEDADVDDVEKALQFIQMPMAQVELERIIHLALKFAEDTTGLPMLLQGQMGQAPDTVGGMKILNDNAGAPLRRVARLFDDLVTEPHVRRYYTYLLQYGEDDQKGDFQVDARGSSALVERDLNTQGLREMGAMVMDPRFGLDPKKWMVELLKSNRFDPKRFEYDDEEWQKVVEQLGQQPPDTSTEVAQIRAQAELQKAEMVSQDKAAERELKIALESLQREKDEGERELTVALEALKRELDEMQIEAGSVDTDKKIKADLSKAIMNLKAQIALNDRDVATPTVEPAGRAPDGQAFQK